MNSDALKQDLTDIIGRQYGKHVEIEMHMKKDRRNTLAEISVDDILKNKINFEVETEES